MEKQIVKQNDFMQDVELSDKEEFDPNDLPLKKRIFYGAMIRSFGNITQSCKVAGIKRDTYRKWMRDDEQFYKLIEGGDFEERMLDFVESKLIEKINAGDIIGILFMLKTRGKKRGYIEGNTPMPRVTDKRPSWFDGPVNEPGGSNPVIEDAVIVEESKEKSNDVHTNSLDEKTA